MFPLNLYARVRISLCTLHTRPRVQRAPGLPCALSDIEEGKLGSNSGAWRRENADACWCRRVGKAQACPPPRATHSMVGTAQSRLCPPYETQVARECELMWITVIAASGLRNENDASRRFHGGLHRLVQTPALAYASCSSTSGERCGSVVHAESACRSHLPSRRRVEAPC